MASDRNIVQELRLLGSLDCPYGCDEIGNPAADAIEELTVERDASRLIISDLTAEVDRLWEQNHELSTRYVELLDALDATRFERDRLRAAGDRLAEFAGDNPWAHLDIATWEAARRG